MQEGEMYERNLGWGRDGYNFFSFFLRELCADREKKKNQKAEEIQVQPEKSDLQKVLREHLGETLC